MKFFNKIPRGVKLLTIVNLTVFLIFMIIETVFNCNLTIYFSANITSSDFFNPVQVITYMFVHSNVDVFHIIGNLTIFILFGIFLEKQIEYRNLVILYIFTGIISFASFNLRKEYEKREFKELCLKNDIDLTKINYQKTGEYDYNEYVQTMDIKQISILQKYSSINGTFLGASGSVFGIIGFFILLNLFNLKHIILKIAGILFIVLAILLVINTNTTVSGTDYGHLGGLIGGCIYLPIYCFIEHKKRSN
jgi:rhomboid-like protein